MPTTSPTGRRLSQIDYDLHGLVRVRLVDAAAEDAAAVSRQLGPIQVPLSAAADLVIRFVDQLPTSSTPRCLGLDEAAFTDDAFLVLRSKHKTQARVQIPLGRIGEQCEIVCQRGLPAVPLLVPIINLTALAKGVLPLHASAFLHEGTGVLTTGWSKGGKTETLLAFTANGAEYIGDEWVYLPGDGRRMYGIPEPIRLWDWHLGQMPRFRARVGRGDRARLGALRLLRAVLRALPQGAGRRGAAWRALRRALPLVDRQLHVDVHPERLFGSPLGPRCGPFDRLLFLVTHESPEISAQPIDPREVARRMVFSLQEERAAFMSYYWKYRFAFPELSNPLIERAEQLERELLLRIFADKPAHVVYHPYPMHLPTLFDVVQSVCRRRQPKIHWGPAQVHAPEPAVERLLIPEGNPA